MKSEKSSYAPSITSKPSNTALTSRLILTLLIAFLVLPVWGQTSHSIKIGWTYTQNADTAVGFNVYRSTVSGGPYTKLTTSLLPLTVLSFTDFTGTGGTTYFYVITAVDGIGIESAKSGEANATFLSAPAIPAGVTATAQ